MKKCNIVVVQQHVGLPGWNNVCNGGQNAMQMRRDHIDCGSVCVRFAYASGQSVRVYDRKREKKRENDTNETAAGHLNSLIFDNTDCQMRCVKKTPMAQRVAISYLPAPVSGQYEHMAVCIMAVRNSRCRFIVCLVVGVLGMRQSAIYKCIFEPLWLSSSIYSFRKLCVLITHRHRTLLIFDHRWYTYNERSFVCDIKLSSANRRHRCILFKAQHTQ